jgi:ATP-dependent exoDNAse (exonuclease V) beta subunit
MATQVLADDQARRTALLAHDRTLLVEAGAGSGKTAVLAGRIALMLVQGIEPKAIAAVTFTELAASELFSRVRQFVSRMLAGDIPAELRLVLPESLTEAQTDTLKQAATSIDNITCSTIHGFCQRLIRPYPVEANVDPGASIMDPAQEQLAFSDIVRDWLHEQLDGENANLLAELMLADPSAAQQLVHTILKHQPENEDVTQPAAPQLGNLLTAFRNAAQAYVAFMAQSPVQEGETVNYAARFDEMSQSLTRWDIATPAGLVGLVREKAHKDLCTAQGEFLKWRRKTAWGTAAKAAGRSKAEGEALNTQAQNLHEECCRTWKELLAGAAAQVLHELMPIVEPAVARMQEYKRAAALLDFNDLLRAARNLLRFYPAVKEALAGKYRHVLVDEFQDTDPVQTEIFWRLCGDPSAGGDAADWRSYRIRPGALFLVGDPKQAIYRFRGADVNAYVWARRAFLAQDAHSVVSIAVNFRSCAPILEYVNQRFAGPLAVEQGQPGFTALQVFHPPRENGPCVAALDVAAAGDNGKASSQQIRDAEAEAVAKLCAHLITSEYIVDPETRQPRRCRPGDIALLAPTGADLWRYEQALEDCGIPVATQAGKGFFRRQEVQDLIALTRALADGQDTLALGALLRGPIVGLTDEVLLDMVWSLRDENDKVPGLSLNLDVQKVQNALAKAVLVKLQGLRRIARGTSPHALLSQAIDELRVRPVLMQRSGRQGERALANVDLFLNFSRAYEVRGLQAFAESMAGAWEDERRAVEGRNRAAEGRPDAQEESVALYSMHAAKGLEWPLVIPINGMTLVKSADRDVLVRATNTLYCPVFGVAPTGHEAAMNDEKQELERERVRLWYVATTRARELMIIPRIDVAASSTAWRALVDLDVASLPAYPLPDEVASLAPAEDEAQNQQTPEVFREEAATVAAAKRDLVWTAPSRDEGVGKPLVQKESSEVFSVSSSGTAHDAGLPSLAIQGGRERGLILHKLLEEVLTGETADDTVSLTSRAAELAGMLGVAISDDASKGLSPVEVVASVRRALAVEAVAGMRQTLVPEFHVYASEVVDNKEHVRAGIVDAICFSTDGSAEAVVDWKSDVDPSAEVVDHYKSQVRAYLEMTGTPRGLIVFATTGAVYEVSL